jgi:hypothetical protein
MRMSYIGHFSSKLENRHITICWQSFVYCNIICSHSCNVNKVHSHSILFDLDCLKIHQGGKQMTLRGLGTRVEYKNWLRALFAAYQGEMASACTKIL